MSKNMEGQSGEKEDYDLHDVLKILTLSMTQIHTQFQDMDIRMQRMEQQWLTPPPPPSNRGGHRGGRGGQRRDQLRGAWHEPHDDYNNQQEYTQHEEDAAYEEMAYNHEEPHEGFQSGHGRIPRGRVQNDEDELKGIKIKIPPFQGKNDPEIYLEWERRVDMVFECRNFLELKKVKLATLEFTDYSLTWWDQLLINKRRYRKRPIETWEDMKAHMRKRFIPQTYYRDLYQKLQRLNQGSKGVEEYYKEMEVIMMRANIEEDREAIMARFVSGLNRDIANVIELHHYVEMEELLEKAMKVEKQLRVSKFSRGSSSNNSFNKPRWNKQDGAQRQRFETPQRPKAGYPKEKQESASNTSKGNYDSKTREIKCFKCLGRGHMAKECPNRRVMLINKDGDYESESDEDKEEKMPPLEDDEQEDDEELPVRGEALVVRRILSTQPVEEETTPQRETIFHTRCLIKGKMCSLIIDGGSCTNVASTYLVEKLGLHTTKHPKPYRLQWLNDSGEVKVTKQVVIPFSIGRYVDEVVCDMAPMQASHIILGRPWQYDRNAQHNGLTNKYTFEFKQRKHTLVPLTP